jgi:CheY-like chemotaxis protein
MVMLRGPKLTVGAQSALHLALMMHELATNAAKYGSLSTPQGTVDVSWYLDDRTLHLTWAERGGPRPIRPDRRGFGTLLIEKSAQGEGGGARMVVNEGGIAWFIRLPLRDISAQSPAAISAAIHHQTAPLHVQTKPEAMARLAGRRILVVEDEVLVAMDISMVLEDAGAEVGEPATNCRIALDRINTEKYDVAILDGNLGGEPIDAVAAALTRRRVPFVFVSGYGHENLPKAFAQAPLLTKPFKPSKLVIAIEDLLAQSPADLPPRSA